MLSAAVGIVWIACAHPVISPFSEHLAGAAAAYVICEAFRRCSRGFGRLFDREA
jgi:hypothetical protein